MRKVFKLHGEITLGGISAVQNALNNLDKQLIVITKNVKKTGEAFEKIGSFIAKTVTLPITALSSTVAIATVKTAEFADKILDLRQKTGLSTDSLQKWNYVVTKTGGSFEEFTKAIIRFTTKMPELTKENSLANRMLSQLNVSLYDTQGNIKELDKLFPEIFSALSGIEDVTNRNVVAAELFGVRYEELAPILGLTSEEINKMFKEAEKLGIVIGEKDLQSADLLGQSINELKIKFTALWNHIAVQIIPILLELYNTYKDKIYTAVDSVIAKVKELTQSFMALDESTKEHYINIAKIGAILVASGPVLIGLGNLIKTLAEVKVLLSSIGLLIKTNPYLLLISGIVMMGVSLITTQKNLEKLNKSMELKNAERMKGLLEELRYNIKQLEEEAGMTESGMIFFVDNEKTRQAKENIEKIEKELGALGIVLKGDLIDKSIQVNELLNEQNKTEEKAIDNKKTEFKLQEAINKKKEEAAEIEKMLAEITEKINKEKAEAEEELLEKNIEYEKAILDEQIKEQEDSLSALKALLRAEKEWEIENIANAAEQQRKLLEMRQEEELESYKNNEEAISYIKQKHVIERAELEKKIEAEKTEELKKQRKEYLNFLTNDIFMLFDTISLAYENERAQIDKNYEKEKDRIDKLNISNTEKEKLKQRLEEETDKKRKELIKKQAAVEKAYTIFSITLKTAEAIMMAMAKLPPALAAIQIGIVSALGAAQIGLVASKPIPAAEGLFVKKRKGGVLLQVGEGRSDELVLPLEKGTKLLSEEIVREINNTTINKPVVNLQIGTLIADETGLRRLQKELERIQLKEAYRKGILL